MKFKKIGSSNEIPKKPEFDDLNSLTSPFPREINVMCSAGIDYCIVDFFGNVYRCYGFSGKKENLLCTLDNPEEYPFNDVKPLCEKMNCVRVCEGYKVQTWKKERAIYDSIYWRNKVNSINEINKDNFFAQIDLCHGCFNACPYCYIGNPDAKKVSNLIFIDYQKTLNFIDVISENKKGIKFINISGSGEPLLHPNCVGIINYATDNGFKIELISSGLLNSKKLLQLKNTEKISLLINYHPSSPNWNLEKMKSLFEKLSQKKFMNWGTVFVKYKGNMKVYEEIKKLNRKYNIYNMSELDYRVTIEENKYCHVKN